MAVNETTGIDPEVDRFALYDTASQSFLNLNATWPRFDGGPIQGGNPDHKYYKRVTTERPDVDHRYTVATTWERVDADPAPPEGHPAGQYLQTHVATKLPAEDLKRQVETEFQRQLQQLFPTSNDPAVLIEAADAITRKQNGAALTPTQQATLDEIVAVGDGVAQLRIRQAELNAAIDAEEDYDLTEGWITSEE